MNISEFNIEDKTIELFRIIGGVADARGQKVYAVGGFVRDMIMDRPCTDLDFVVEGNGPEFAMAVKDALQVPTCVLYEQFQTAFIPYGEFKLEFVSARSESYASDSRKPSVQQATLHEDILRRDFTVNALALSLNAETFGSVVDHLGGIDDIAAQIIRTPLDPIETFSDDPLRIMRAIRFASQLGFRIDEKTYAGIESTVERLEIISMERIRDEFLKILGSQKPSLGLWLLYNTGILEQILPELTVLYGVDEMEGQKHKNNFSHTLIVVDRLAERSDSIELRLAALFHDIGKAVTKKYDKEHGWTFYNHEYIGSKMIRGIFERMKLTKNASKYVTKLVKLHGRPVSLMDEGVSDSGIRRLIVDAGEELDDLMVLAQADMTSRNKYRIKKNQDKYAYLCQRLTEVKEKDRLRAFQSPVRGLEIMEIAQLPAGPEVGRLKKAIEEAILEGDIQNTYEEARDYLVNVLLK
jgi:putative nucleotidyltransferase with HDIG domain